MMNRFSKMEPGKQAADALGSDRPLLDGSRRPEVADPQWLNVYDQVAQRVLEQIQPATVLDVGCGIGLLVERLRRRRIKAVGVDPDERLIARADSKIRPYLTRADFDEPFPGGPYALVTSIGALSGLHVDSAAAAIRNICRKTDDVLFSARIGGTGAEGDRPAGEIGFWAGLFAENEFYRDPDFDATFITPWAARYRRRPGLKLTDLVKENEGGFISLWTEVSNLRALVESLAATIKRDRIEYETIVGTLEAQVEDWEALWAGHEESLGGKFLHFFRVLVTRLAPPGSRRESFLWGLRDRVSQLQQRSLRNFVRWRRRESASNEDLPPGDEAALERRNADLYRDFVERSTPTEAELDQLRSQAETWKHRPLISIVTPVFNPPADALRAMLDSVLKQVYGRWELCIADASLDTPDVRQILEDYAGKDPRIRVRYLTSNLGISRNSNVAIEMAEGEYIAFLDHDDVLEPRMLFEVVSRIRANEHVDVIYFDEDKLTADGLERRDPFFKPDFSPEMLLSANYLAHAVYRRSLVEEVGRFRPAYDGCQDWDLAFRATEKSDQVEHISKVLYHWRQVGDSTAADFNAKSYVFNRQLRCVEEHLRRVGIYEPRANFPIPGFLRVTWPVSDSRVSIIVPTRDRVAYLKRAVDSIVEQTGYSNYEIIIVDNDSREARTRRYLDELRREDYVRVVDFNEKFNYSRANNVGVERADGRFLLFLNNDVEITHEDWLDEMVRWAELREIGAVGGKLVYPDETIQHAGVVVGLEGHASHVFWGYVDRQSGPFGSVDWYRNWSAVTGACMMMRRETFDQVGGFDEKYTLAFSDVEICLRIIEHGYRIVYTPYTRLRHYEGRSRGSHIPFNDLLAGSADFYSLIEQGDPYFNPNLSYNLRKPTIRHEDNEEDRLSRLDRVTLAARLDR